ncbi:hypothetical protein Pint_06722 [Pistacia integerrima]|uniref:Uncharacterized protein n=1 Tax=Pistacia integerrima TaxID=434235 RepID=A0ACC0XTZ8_9ROSI|nr:hypothetical protein Pint_06722 [Pistacia integerrima]
MPINMGSSATRQPGNPVQSVVAHQDEVTSLSFNPFDERTLATGSADKMVNLYDLRNVNKARYTFTDHRNVVNQGDWDIASVAEDNDLQTWKITNHYDQGRLLSRSYRF